MLFDFANAVLALSHVWVFAVFHAMQAPSKLFNIIKVIYAYISSDPDYVGVPVVPIDLRTGIRQGCPLPGTIFALALDPFVWRHLSCPVFVRTRIFLYADDLASALKDVYRLFPLVLRALHHWSLLASGLTLKPAKCVVLHLWDGDYTELINFVSSLPGFTAGAVRTSAQHLGVDLGARAADTKWAAVCPKLTRRALDIRYAGASPPTRMPLHNTRHGQVHGVLFPTAHSTPPHTRPQRPVLNAPLARSAARGITRHALARFCCQSRGHRLCV